MILEFVKHCNVVEDAFKIYRHVNLSQEEAVKRGEFGVMDRKYFRLVLNFTINPHWHELWKQEKCSSFAPPMGHVYKTQWAWQGVKLTLSISIFNSKEVWKFLIKIQLAKILSKKDKEIKVFPLMLIRVNFVTMYISL